ncbi:MAG: GEVED domain-containing protein [Bacteroidota bacterium]
MKYLSLLLLLLPTLLPSQVLPVLPYPGNASGQPSARPPACGVPPASPAQIRHTLEVIDRQTVLRNSGTTCIPLHIIDVREDNGNGALDMGELNKGIANLNHFFLPAGVEFYLCGTGMTVVNSSTYYDFSVSQESALASLAPEVTNAVNVFFVNSIVASSGNPASGYASFPSNTLSSNRVLMDKEVLTLYPNGTFVHEFGHWLNLFHTHQGTEFGNTYPTAEHVARTGPTANCDTQGDLLCDTEADPRYNSTEFSFSSCAYTGTATDIHGIPYSPLVQNVMSYFPDECGGSFTPQQYTRAAAALSVRQGHTAYSLSCPPSSVADPTNLTASYLPGLGVSLSWTDNASNEMGYVIERSTTSANSGFQALPNGGVGPNVNSFVDEDLIANTTHYYRVKASNDQCNDYSNVVSEVIGLVHCIPFYQSNANCNSIPAYLDDFSIATLTNNGSGCSNISNSPVYNYGNFSSTLPAPSLQQGHAYTFSVSGSLTKFYSIWIDLDQDGTFEDCELLYHSTSSEGTSTSNKIRIPLGAHLGTTILRVRASNQTVMTDACGYTPFGETEDYEVSIAMPDPCPAWSSIPSAQGSYAADTVCWDGAWLHFFQAANPTQRLFSVENLSGSGALMDPSDLSIEVTSGYGAGGHNLSSAAYVTNPLGWYAMGRYWQATPCSPTTQDLKVRFYFDNQDVQDVNGSIPGSITGPAQLRFFHLSDPGENPNPASAAHLTVNLGTYKEAENAGIAGTDTWVQQAYGTYDHAEYMVSRLVGGGGGSGGGGNNTGANSILPVSFLRVNGEVLPGKNLITWTTAYERQNKWFEIEKFDPAQQAFRWVGQVASQGDAEVPTSYSFIDKQPSLGTNQYRIKQVDRDGRYQYSSTVELQTYVAGSHRIFPNPATEEITLWMNVPQARQVGLSLWDASGKQIWSKSWPQLDQQFTTVDISAIPAGFYVYRFAIGQTVTFGKLTIQ